MYVFKYTDILFTLILTGIDMLIEGLAVRNFRIPISLGVLLHMCVPRTCLLIPVCIPTPAFRIVLMV